jgi:hypothetical protein
VGSVTAPSTDVVEIDAFFRDAELAQPLALDSEVPGVAGAAGVTLESQGRFGMKPGFHYARAQ